MESEQDARGHVPGEGDSGLPLPPKFATAGSGGPDGGYQGLPEAGILKDADAGDGCASR